MKRMSSSACDVLRRAPRRSRPRASARARVRVELVVDREVREVEEAVSHARVLPVDDAQALAVVEEVRVQEVVVARDGAFGRRLASILVASCVRPVEGLRDTAAAIERGSSIGLDDAERVERAGNRRRRRETHAARAATRLSICRLAHPLERRDLARDESCHEPALRLDERDDLGPDAERGGRLGRRELDRAVDPEQAGVLPRDPEHEASPSTSTFRLWFVMPPPSTSTRASTTRPDALDRSREVAHARMRSPVGSNSGSAATTPGTHSPKISTAISVPTSCSAGRYAYAIDFSTV